MYIINNCSYVSVIWVDFTCVKWDTTEISFLSQILTCDVCHPQLASHAINHLLRNMFVKLVVLPLTLIQLPHQEWLFCS
jgi:hypothetical protein